MFFENLSFCEGDVLKHYVLEEVERELAKEVLAKVRIACYEVHGYGSRISGMCESTTQEWKDFCLTHKDAYLELAKKMDEFEQKYFEDDTGLPLTNKKMIKMSCNRYFVTCAEMSSMYYFMQLPKRMIRGIAG